VPSNIVEQLDPIFKPKSVAIIGASKNPMKWGGMMLNGILSSEFRGRIYPVNPKAKNIRGVKAYPSVLEIPDDIDLGVFAVPAAHMPGVMEDCVRKGVRGGILISADFAETGEKGKALEDETVRIARKGGIRFVGPNGNGILSSAVRLNFSPFPSPRPGPLAFISQSGTLGGIAARTAIEKRFGLSKFVAMGNQADLCAADYVEYLGHDEDTSVIAIYVEGIKDGRRFFKTAKEVVKQKPILLMKGGRTEHGARATLSHTASIAGADDVFDAMCRQAGILRVFEVEHLFTMAEALTVQPLPKGNRIAIIAEGGQGVIISDFLSSHGLDVPEFSEVDKQKLKKIMPPHAPTPRNPVDYAAGAVEAGDEVRVVEMLASLDYIDGIVTNIPYGMSLKSSSMAEQKKEMIDAVDAFSQIPQKCGKPIVTQTWFPSPDATDILRNTGIPIYKSSEDCARAMTALVRYGEIQRRMNA